MHPFKRQILLWSSMACLSRTNAAGLLPIIKGSVSLSSGVLPYNFIQMTPGSSSVTSWELGLREPAKYDDTLATAIIVSNSPCFSPGVSCLQPASMKLWHAHLLACKDYTISDPSQFWTLCRPAGTVVCIGVFK